MLIKKIGSHPSFKADLFLTSLRLSCEIVYDFFAAMNAIYLRLDCRELKMYRDRIVGHMEKRKQYMNPTPSEEKATEIPATTSSSKRTSMRRKEQPPVDTVSKTYRCLSWRNLTALEELGHLHSDPPRVRKPSKKNQAAQADAGADEDKAEKAVTRGKKDKAKGSGRQNGR